MSLRKITLGAAALLACAWGTGLPCSSGAPAEQAVSGFLPPESWGAPGDPPWSIAEDSQKSDAPTFNVVRFAAGTVEVALPRDWKVKQVPLSREIRLVAGPDNVPDDPSRLERGLWLAYHRTPSSPPAASAPVRPVIEEELRSRLPKAAAGGRIVGPPEPIRIGGFSGLKQRVELVGSAHTELVRRATYLVAQTPWGLLEVMTVAPLFAEGNVSPTLVAIVASLAFQAPHPLPAVSAPEIASAEAALGSWKGQKASLHLLGNGRIRMEFDAVMTLEAQPDKAVSHQPGESIEGSFTARGDLIFITWDDGRKLNYRWRLEQGDLQLMDHDRKFSCLARLFDAPATLARTSIAPPPPPAKPTPAVPSSPTVSGPPVTSLSPPTTTIIISPTVGVKSQIIEFTRSGHGGATPSR